MQQYHHSASGLDAVASTKSVELTQNNLTDICGPPMPLPFDEEYYYHPNPSLERQNQPTGDYTYGFLSSDAAFPTHFDDNHSDLTDIDFDFSAEPQLFFDNLEEELWAVNSDSVVGFGTGFTSYPSFDCSWHESMNYALGFDERTLFEFSDVSIWPTPREECVVPDTIDTMCRVW